MAEGPESGRWPGHGEESPGEEELDGLELAEVPTAPARLEDQGTDAGPARAPARASTVAAAAGTGAPVRRGRGGRPRVNEEQDRRIIEAFERAKKEQRSLKEVASELARDLAQPADYINQRYYYLQRKARPGGLQATAPDGRRRGRAAQQARLGEDEGPAATQTGPGRGRRGRRRAAEAEIAPAPPAPAAVPAARAPQTETLAAAPAGLERMLTELSDTVRRELGSLADQLRQIQSRLDALEQRPPSDVPVDEVLTRLGQVLEERGRAQQGRARIRQAMTDFLKTLDEAF